jgi:hypothetical protein
LMKLSVFVWTDKWLICLPKYHVPYHVLDNEQHFHISI